MSLENVTSQDQEKTAPENAPGVEKAPAAPKKSWFGRTMFFLGNELGINWLLNTFVSLFITFNLNYSKFAEKGLSKYPIIGNLYPGREKLRENIRLHNPNLPEPVVGKMAWHKAEVPLMYIAGFLLFIPMGIIEQHKVKIVRKLDHIWGMLTHKKFDQETQKKIDEADKDVKPRSWKELLLARLSALSFIQWVGIPGYSLLDKKLNGALDGKLVNEQGKEVLENGLLHNIGEKLINWFPRTMTKLSEAIERNEKVPDSTWDHLPLKERRVKVFAEQAKTIQKETLLTLVFALFMSMGGRLLYSYIFGGKEKEDLQKKNRELEHKLKDLTETKKETPAAAADVSDAARDKTDDMPDKAFASQIKPKSSEPPRPRTRTEMVERSQDQEAAISL